jgi:hypothetical protein
LVQAREQLWDDGELLLARRVPDDGRPSVLLSFPSLAHLAVPADRIDEAKVEEARKRAEARLHEKLSDEEHAAVNASLTRSLVQLRVKRRRRG